MYDVCVFYTFIAYCATKPFWKESLKEEDGQNFQDVYQSDHGVDA